MIPALEADPPSRARAWRIAIVAAVSFVYLSGIWMLPLQEPDEGRYGDIAASMARTGDWLTPRLNGIRYYEKPPLYFWLGAACVAVLGPTEAAVRLPSALACLGTILLLMRWGRRVGGFRVELPAGAMGATLPLFALFAHMAMVDLVLAFLSTCALYFAWRGIVEPADTSSGFWIRGFWAACALAMLTKGPIGVALPLVSILAWLVLTRDWDRLRALARPDGPALFGLIAAPWFLAMEAANPGYLRDFFVGQNYARAVAGAVFDRNAPPWFYLPALATYFLPWILFLPGVLRSFKVDLAVRLQPEERLRLLLACSILAPLAILSVAQSKIGYYLLPLAPPLALLAACHAGKSWNSDPAAIDPRALRVRSRTLAGFGLLILAMAGAGAIGAAQDPADLNAGWGRENVGPYRTQKAIEFIKELQEEGPLIVSAGLVAGAGFLAAAALMLNRKPLDSLLSACLVLAVLEFSALAVAARLPPLHTARNVARCLETKAGKDEPIVLLEEYMTSIPFYLRRPVTIADATFPMFGHAVSDAEAAGLSLQDRPERLESLLAGNDSVLVVCRSPNGEARVKRAGRGGWETLERVGRFAILRHTTASVTD